MAAFGRNALDQLLLRVIKLGDFSRFFADIGKNGYACSGIMDFSSR